MCGLEVCMTIRLTLGNMPQRTQVMQDMREIPTMTVQQTHKKQRQPCCNDFRTDFDKSLLNFLT